jgi:hypothetical protein
MFWTGAILTGVVVLFLAFDGISKVLRVQPVMKASQQLGQPANTIVPIGIVLLACTVIYVIPQTAVLGAILLTAYLGGATAMQVRAEGGTFPVVFSIMTGVLAWAGLLLREPRLLWTILMRQ